MDPAKWGATTWWFEHWLANKVDSVIMSSRAQGHVGESDTKFQLDLLKLFVDFIVPFNEELIPCQSCQKSSRVFMRVLSPKDILKTFRSTHQPTASRFVHDLHNIVNQKLKKPQFTPEQFHDFSSSTEFQTFPLANLEYIASAIEHCLNKWKIPRKHKLFVTAFSKYLAPLLVSLHNNASLANLTSAQRQYLQRHYMRI